MTRVRETSDNDLPLVDRRARSGTVLRILLLALVLIAAAAAFVYFKDSLENEIVLGILGVLAMMGIFFLVSSIIGFIEVMPQSQSDGLARRFLSAHPDGTLITDAKGHMVYANATYCRMSGTTKASDIQSLETLLSRSRDRPKRSIASSMFCGRGVTVTRSSVCSSRSGRPLPAGRTGTG